MKKIRSNSELNELIEVTKIAQKYVKPIISNDTKNKRVKFYIDNNIEVDRMLSLIKNYSFKVVLNNFFVGYYQFYELEEFVNKIMYEIIKTLIYYGPTPCGKPFGIFFKRVIYTTICNIRKRK